MLASCGGCAELAKCLAQQGRKEEGEAFVVRAEGLADLKPKLPIGGLAEDVGGAEVLLLH